MPMFLIEVPTYGMQTFKVDAVNRGVAIDLILAGSVEPTGEMPFDLDMDSNNWLICEAYPPVTICDDELDYEGYMKIVSQDGKGKVVLRNHNGRHEFFAIRDSYAGWCVHTDDGRVLEFIHSESNDDWTRRIKHDA